MWGEVNNLDYLDSCNYKYEKHKMVLRGGHSKSIFIVVPIISIFILSMSYWSIKTYGLWQNNKTGIIAGILVLFGMIIPNWILNYMDYKKVKEIEKNFKDIEVDKNEVN